MYNKRAAQGVRKMNTFNLKGKSMGALKMKGKAGSGRATLGL